MSDNRLNDIKRNLNVVAAQTVPQCPYAFAAVYARYRGKLYRGIGFSKACYPDKWNEVFGIELAKDRALYDIAGQVLTSTQ